LEVSAPKYISDWWMVSWEVGVMIDDDDVDVGGGFAFRIEGR